MDQNAQRSPEVLPRVLRRLSARWLERRPRMRPNVTAMVTVDGGSWIEVAPGSKPPATTADDGDPWVTFSLRTAHSRSRTIAPFDAPYLLAVRVFASDADRDEFRRWLDEEHCRLQVTIPGVNWYLGYEEAQGQRTFLNLWGVDRPGVIDGEAWKRVRDTPWWTRVSHVPDNAVRGIYRLVPSEEG